MGITRKKEELRSQFKEDTGEDWINSKQELNVDYIFNLEHRIFLLESQPPQITEEASPETIKDGFGSEWSKECAECHELTMQVVRPGKVQCAYCG